MLALNKKIRYIRVLREMSQDELAIATGIDRSLISRMESGYVSPTAEQLSAIEQALRLPSDEAVEAAFRALAGEPSEACAK